tara:strand:- start:24947 stop:26719 length:1773 start_codon:yes stop_codon:yes gene_type:complete
MLILGISCFFHDASAVLLDDGKLLCAAEEERFTRIKHDYDFPTNAISFCLQQAEVTGADIDYVVFFEKPFIKFERLLKTAISGFPRSYRLFEQSMRTWLFDKLWIRNLIQQEMGIPKNKIVFSDHHLSHASSAYFCSPFQDAAVLTIDGVGEWSTATMGYASETDLLTTQELHFPHSLGLLYSAFTAFLGFEINEGEYKVMGMAPYGEPKYTDKVEQVVKINHDGSIWMDPAYFQFHFGTGRSYSRKFEELFGTPRDPNVPFVTATTGIPSYYQDEVDRTKSLFDYNQRYADIAASIQTVVEEIILKMARHLHSQTGAKNLCLAGGVALNSVANGRILRETEFQEIYVQPSAGDGGGSLGAALYAWHGGLGKTDRFIMDHTYWGQQYTEAEIKSSLDEAGLSVQEFNSQDELVNESVDRLTSGKVIGWFQGKFEWGPRALGNRSILADPRRAEMKDIVNTKIKFREPFRPFAPAVTLEAAPDFFDIPETANGMPERFMLLVVPVWETKSDQIPAVSHLGTARVQVVHHEANPLYSDLIATFGDATGTPVLMNTSFNIRGEPIVSSPEDAIRTFGNSGIDTLVIGNFLVEK